MILKPLVGSAEVVIAKKAFLGGVRTWVVRFQNKVLIGID
jgi:hypothetical protein